MKKQPLLILCSFFVLGILFQDFFAIQGKWVFIILLISILSLISLWIKSVFFQKMKMAVLCVFFFGMGVFSHFLNSWRDEIPMVGQNEHVVFKIDKKLNANEKNRRYEVTIFYKDKSFKSVLSVPKSEKELDFAHFYKAELFINRVLSPNNTYQFDYQKYLRRKNIYFQSYLPGSFSVAEKKDMDLSEKIKQKRLETLQRIDSSELSKNTKDFLKGIILADRTEMDSSITQDFTKSGLVHFLAISGTHMVVIFLAVMFVLKRVFPLRQNNLATVLSLAFIWLFAVFIDYGSSVVRSCLMLSIYYGFVLLQRKPDLLHSLALAAFVILIFDTNQIFDVGFQLSFLAVFGIFWLNKPILKLLPRPKNKVQRFFLNIFSVTLSAQIITLPLILYYFHQFSLMSVVANLFIVPLSEIIIVFSLIMTVVIGFFGGFPLVGDVYDFIVAWLLKFIHFFAEFNSVYFERIPFSLTEAVIVFVSIFILRQVLIRRNLKYFLRFSFVLLAFFFVRLTLNFTAFNRDEALVHSYFKDKIFSVKRGGTVYFWVSEKADRGKVLKTIISPYLVYSRCRNFKIFTLPKDVVSVNYEGSQIVIK